MPSTFPSRSWCLAAFALLLIVGCGPASSASGDAAVPPLADLPTVAVPLSVAEAYAAIPHRQTSFRFDETAISDPEAGYLAAMFFLIDQATRVRVSAYGDLYHHGTTSSRPVEQFQSVIDAIRALPVPTVLAEYHQSILEALVAQQAVFREWTEAGSGFPYRDQIGRHRAVRGASGSLQRAYALLMARYGSGESKSNQEAMFDYHCALDFL